jgi:hypothetical protein
MSGFPVEGGKTQSRLRGVDGKNCLNPEVNHKMVKISIDNR